MSHEQLDEKAIFNIARRIDAPDARAEYLSQVCGANRGLLQRVEAVLRGYEMEASFLRTPVPEDLSFTVDAPRSEGPGAVIGPYKLLEQIGEGGFGIVYVAEQSQPVRRKVAVKLLKPGMDSRQVIARFEAERQALALMDHPNIARVLDAATTDTGRPYFVMELVKGVPITEYCEQMQLDMRERLLLFMDVCRAVQHAHQKGIIHRDLKPSNVLVSQIDGRPVAKVIDFGIAKATGQQLTDKTLYTAFAQLLGTPLYMSPEQAALSGVDVDTRSDVYSLGVMLYELLTCTTPFTKEMLAQAGYDELRRIIREDEPPRPSTRISTLNAQAASTIATRQHTKVQHLSRQLRHELDWIAMKALEKDRNRRYETANGLAQDIQSYLNNEAVLACPPSTAYRLAKFARRNRSMLITASVVSLALLAGTAVSTWQALQANRARRLADERLSNEVMARREADEQQRRAEAERARAEANFKKAEQAVDQLLIQVGDERLRGVPQMERLRANLLEQALKFRREFLEERSDDREVRFLTANACQRLGRIQYELGQYKKSEDSLRQGILLFEGISAEPADFERCQLRLARVRENLALVLLSRGKKQESEATVRQSLDILEQLTERFPEGAPGYRMDEANSLQTLGVVLEASGQQAAAETTWRKELGIRSQLADERPDDANLRGCVARCYTNLGVLLCSAGKLSEAEKSYRQATGILEKLVAENRGFRASLAIALNNLGNLLNEAGRLPEAEDAGKSAISVSERLISDFPSVPDHRNVLANAKSNLGNVLLKSRKLPEAEIAFRGAVETFAALRNQSPETLDYALGQGGSSGGLGLVLLETGRVNEAETLLAESIAIAEQLVGTHPKTDIYTRALAQARGHLGVLKFRVGDWDSAATLLQQAVEQPGDEANNGDIQFFLAMTCSRLGQSKQANTCYARAVQWMDRNASHEPRLAQIRAEAESVLRIIPGSHEPM